MVPIAGGGKARFQPIWAEDVADCLVAALERPGPSDDGRRAFDLAGPESLSYDEIVRSALRPERPRAARSSTCRCPWSAPACARLERVVGPAVFATAGGGRPDGGADDHLRAAPPTPRRSGSTRCG